MKVLILICFLLIVNLSFGQIKIDKAGIIHASIGRVSFEPTKLAENAQELINTLVRMKPPTAKGTYLKGISMASTMSPGLSIDTKSVG